MNVIYTGELVRLRPFRDLAEWQSLQREYEFYMSPFWGPFNWPEAEQIKSFEEAGALAIDKHTSFAIERLDTGETVGIEEHGGLVPGRLATWLGTCIAARHHSRGFGREAKLLMLCHLFENFPICSVIADTTAEHLRAQAGLQAIGMHPVGSYRACHWRAGNIVDVPNYQIMREEWEEMTVRRTVIRG
jgi:RimJ/RimL family protein N-acetyltransferase